MKCQSWRWELGILWLLYTIFTFLSVDDGVALVYDMPGYMKPYAVARKGHEKKYEIGVFGCSWQRFRTINH